MVDEGQQQLHQDGSRLIDVRYGMPATHCGNFVAG
jgi:hypothetical protein